MPRKKANGHAPETPTQEADTKRAKVRSIIGGNVAPETLKKHWAEINRLELLLRTAQGNLAAAWKAAESDGIAKKPGKLVFKLFKEDPATADAFMRQIQSYATQLGLFDKIDNWKAEEEQEANKGSADRAESDLRNSASSQTGEPKSGDRESAIYAQGYEAGLANAPRSQTAYFGEDAETWQRGYHAGATKAMDATNSARATEMASAQA